MGASYTVAPRGGGQGETGQQTKKREEDGEKGRSLRLTPCSIFKVMLFVSAESVIPAVPNRKGCRVSPFCPCGKEPKLIAFGLKGNLVSIWSLPTQSSIREDPFCHMLPKSRFRQVVGWSLE